MMMSKSTDIDIKCTVRDVNLEKKLVRFIFEQTLSSTPGQKLEAILKKFPLSDNSANMICGGQSTQRMRR